MKYNNMFKLKIKIKIYLTSSKYENETLLTPRLFDHVSINKANLDPTLNFNPPFIYLWD